MSYYIGKQSGKLAFETSSCDILYLETLQPFDLGNEALLPYNVQVNWELEHIYKHLPAPPPPKLNTVGVLGRKTKAKYANIVEPKFIVRLGLFNRVKDLAIVYKDALHNIKASSLLTGRWVSLQHGKWRFCEASFSLEP